MSMEMLGLGHTFRETPFNPLHHFIDEGCKAQGPLLCPRSQDYVRAQPCQHPLPPLTGAPLHNGQHTRRAPAPSLAPISVCCILGSDKRLQCPPGVGRSQAGGSAGISNQTGTHASEGGLCVWTPRAGGQIRAGEKGTESRLLVLEKRPLLENVPASGLLHQLGLWSKGLQ